MTSVAAAAEAAVEYVPRLPEPVAPVAEGVAAARAAGAVTVGARASRRQVAVVLGSRHARVCVRHPAARRWGGQQDWW